MIPGKLIIASAAGIALASLAAATVADTGSQPTITFGADEVDLSWSSQFGCTYQLQGSGSLSTWNNLGPALAGDGTVHSVLDGPGIPARRYYRIVRTCSGVPAQSLDIPYPPPAGGDPAMSLLDLYYLPDGQPRRLLVFVHGGSWTGGDKGNLSLAPSFVPWFLDRGYVVASLNFRLASGPPGPQTVTYADQATDIAHALAWLNTNAPHYGASKPGVVLLGYSSGAHLVALLASDESYLQSAGLSLDHLAASISFDVHAYDVPYALQLMQGSVLQNNIPFIRYIFGTTEAQQRIGSPTTYAEHASVPATLLVSADPSQNAPGSIGWIAAQASQNYAQLLTGWGHDATWTHFDNETHASLMLDFGNAGDGPTNTVAAFLDGLELP